MAGVVGCTIAIITTFTVIEQGVAAILIDTCTGTPISVHSIPVITLLTCLDEAIPADGLLAAVGARVRVVCISVVAFLNSSVNEAIAAACRCTGVEAVIEVRTVAVITDFHALLDVAISARGDLAGVETVICIDVVSIVAGFEFGTNRSIPAGCTEAGAAAVGIAASAAIGVAIVANLSFRTSISVATGRACSYGRTVCIARPARVGVAVVAGLTGRRVDRAVAAVRARGRGAGGGLLERVADGGADVAGVAEAVSIFVLLASVRLGQADVARVRRAADLRLRRRWRAPGRAAHRHGSLQPLLARREELPRSRWG